MKRIGIIKDYSLIFGKLWATVSRVFSANDIYGAGFLDVDAGRYDMFGIVQHDEHVDSSYIDIILYDHYTKKLLTGVIPLCAKKVLKKDLEIKRFPLWSSFAEFVQLWNKKLSAENWATEAYCHKMSAEVTILSCDSWSNGYAALSNLFDEIHNGF